MGSGLSIDCDCVNFTRNSNSFFLNLPIKNPNMKPPISFTSNPNVSLDKSYETSLSKVSIEDFVIHKILGKGEFGKVLLVKKKNTLNAYFAMKIIRKVEMYAAKMSANIKLEKQVLQKANSPFIVNLFYFFQTPTKIYFVMEYLSGGDLFHFLRKKKKFTLDAAKFYICEVILALEYLHEELNLLYRDLKPENILLTTDGHIKLTDFGLAKSSLEVCNSFVGTSEYAAPEIILNKEQCKKVDIWTCGVLLFEFLAGVTPFKHENSGEMYKKIVNKTLKFPNFFNDETKDLIDRMLTVIPNERISLEEIKKHEFFKGIDWDHVRDLRYQAPYKTGSARINDNDQIDLKESYDLNSFPDLSGLSYNVGSNLEED